MCLLVGVVLAAAFPFPARAGMQELLEAIKASEFRFARSSSDVPFMPLGWVMYHYYPDARFEHEQDLLPEAKVEENNASVGAVMPVVVRTRDMILLGADASLDDIGVKSGPLPGQTVARITPVAAWLHQFSRDNLAGSFVAPMFSKEIRNGGEWGTSGYAGIVAMHWRSETLQWLYGGVYQNSFGQDTFYPYLGLLWNPGPRLSVSLVFPWPALTYAPNDNWIVSLNVSPGGSSWVRRHGNYEVTETFGSWNLSVGTGYRIKGNFWLYGSAGLAGLRAWEFGEPESGQRYESEPSVVFSFAFQFRP